MIDGPSTMGRIPWQLNTKSEQARHIHAKKELQTMTSDYENEAKLTPEAPRPDLDVDMNGMDLERQISMAESMISVPEISGETLQNLERRMTAQERDEAERFTVKFGEGDPHNPHNWSVGRRWALTVFTASLTFCVALTSSIYSTDVFVLQAKFKISREVAILGITFFVLAFGFGPLIWAPMSEIPAIGRRPVYLLTWTGFIIFQVPTAVAQNAETLIVCRFLAGFFGSSCLTIAGATLADIWPPAEIGAAMAVFGVMPFLGPVLGPVIGGFIVTSSISWRWTLWIPCIFSGALGIAMVLCMPETQSKAILRKRAKALRKETNDMRWCSVDMLQKPLTMKQLVAVVLLRPLKMLFTEPIVFLMSLYLAFVYGILYLSFESYPFIFAGLRQWSLGFSGLSFLGMLVGMVIAASLSPLQSKLYVKMCKAKGVRILPEARLPFVIPAAFLVPIALFWLAWTANPKVHWIAPVLSGIPFGAGMVIIFLGVLNYLVDSYLMMAASAMAANSLMRSLLGAVFPLFAEQMYDDLHANWATTVLAFISLALAPIPLLFYIYGARIRRFSKMTAKL